ncbi:lysophospholipid acyltransferase family protein [Gordonia sp. DT30]|uniref:lysophospholipid acyltransferase family protein n=1 Tax=unclassified Gordonia (in: high G+C Gram-positive bacteria) TaxID=2657482 RepID=UPI003CF14FD4
MSAAVGVAEPQAEPLVVPATAPPRPAVARPHAWYPTSPCAAHCLEHSGPQVGRVVLGLRIAHLLAVVAMAGIAGLFIICSPRSMRRVYLRRVARELLRALGIRVDIDDRRPSGSPAGGLIVANHISYLDILAIAVVQPAHFVAKSDVTTMPGISLLARRLGVIGIDRASLRTLPSVIEQTVAGLDRGASVAVFPEGTTWCGRAQGGFRPAFFQSALDAGVPILPISIGFTARGIRTAQPGFIGDDGPGDTLRRVLRSRHVAVHVGLHRPQLPTGDRRSLAAACEGLIRSGGPW